MDDQVSWLLELAVKPGKLDDLRALVVEMVESTRAEPGALSFEWFLSDDEGTVDIYERYADSAAVMAHMANFGERFASRFLAALQPTRSTVFGPASDEVRSALEALGATHMSFFGGFVR